MVKLFIIVKFIMWKSYNEYSNKREYLQWEELVGTVVNYTKWWFIQRDLHSKVIYTSENKNNNCEIWEKLFQKKRERGEYIETILFISRLWKEILTK